MAGPTDRTRLSRRVYEHSAAAHLLLVLLGEAVAYAMFCAALARVAGLPATTSVGLWLALFLATRLALVLASFAFAWWMQRPWHLPPRRWLNMIVQELTALLRFEWLILAEPFRREARDLPRLDPSSPLVIFIHGIYCNRGIWRPLMKQLRHAGCEVRAESVTPCTAELAVQVRKLAQSLAGTAACGRTRRIVVVAHSLGGLLARSCLSDVEVDTLICIATPHAGSIVARALLSPIG
ncbi:MAG: alpha/beta fold hydrolase, partial [Steroidobacteraceae bacterium]